MRNSHTNPTEGLLLDATFRKGFKELGKRNLSFDAWLYHPQIPQLTDLARAFPGTTIISITSADLSASARTKANAPRFSRSGRSR